MPEAREVDARPGSDLRLLALADEAPSADPARIAVDNGADAVVALGDLDPGTLAALADVDLPRFGVHGNHDPEGELERHGFRDLHLALLELGGWSFAGFEGCVRYRKGPHQYSQDEAAELARGLPAAEVLVCHAPPWGIDDEPDDPVHVGFRGLRDWLERHRPRYVLHGHTQPDPRTRAGLVGATEVVWVRGAAVVELRRPPAPRSST